MVAVVRLSNHGAAWDQCSTRVRVRICVHPYAHAHTCTSIRLCACVHVCVCMHTHIRIYTNAHHAMRYAYILQHSFTARNIQQHKMYKHGYPRLHTHYVRRNGSCKQELNFALQSLPHDRILLVKFDQRADVSASSFGLLAAPLSRISTVDLSGTNGLRSSQFDHLVARCAQAVSSRPSTRQSRS
jgi:hypothetical protein